jgi:nucleoid DNA-binding protein
VEDEEGEAGRSKGRAYLVEELGKHGLSRRQAVQVINAAFAEMGRALARGQRVVFPFGHLERVRHKHPRVEGRFLNRMTAQYKNPYTVQHVVNRQGERLLRAMEGEQDRRKRPAASSPDTGK